MWGGFEYQFIKESVSKMDSDLSLGKGRIDACVLFVDIANSTQLYETLGDKKPVELPKNVFNFWFDG